MSRPPTKRSMSSDKALPALPAGGLGIDFSGLTKDDIETRNDHNMKLYKSPAPPFVPLRQSPIAPTRIPSSPSVISLSPSTPLASSSAYPFPYTNGNYSRSTILNRSTTTLTTQGSPSGIIPPKPNPTCSVTPKQKVGFGKSSISADSINSQKFYIKSYDGPSSSSEPSQASGSLLKRKGSSGQLLSGIGKGLNRVGSVIRRNTEGNIGLSTNNQSPRKFSTSTWKRGRRKTTGWDDSWEKVKRIGEEVDEGDKGIGRPFNVGHDLHVSPDLSDLPERWLLSLKAQGLTESDLLLISAARKKQHENANSTLPIRGSSRLYQAPLSAPPSRFLDAPFRQESPLGPSSELSHSALLKKFSFENSPSTTPMTTPTRRHDQPHQLELAARHLSLESEMEPEVVVISRAGRRKIDSFPVSAAGSSDTGHITPLSQDQPPVPATSAVSITEDSESYLLPRSRNKKRFSRQIQTFRESTFGLGEEDEGEWGKSILDQTLTKASYPSSTPPDERLKDDRIPVPPESPSCSTRNNKWLDKPTLSGYKTPSKRPSIEDLPKSPPPPARSRRSPSASQVTYQISSPFIPLSEDEHEPRKSSESFGVHYDFSMSKSKSSVGSEIITPSMSMEDSISPRVIELDEAYSDEGNDHQTLSKDNNFDKLNPTLLKIDSPQHCSRPGIRTFQSNPDLSLPSSAIDSRPTTLDSLHLIPLSQKNQTTPKTLSLKPQSSYSTFNSEIYKSIGEDDDDILNGLDKADSEERASIALSILSSRTSTSAQSLNELREAIVSKAYKLTPVNEIYDERDKVWNEMENNNESRNPADSTKDVGESIHHQVDGSSDFQSTINTGSSRRGSMSMMSTNTGWELVSGEFDERNDNSAKDAMDALGEAAKRLKSK
ncbi:uncharacterized protein I206_101453 [Kwoniella pini CBS 10737]|uniref:CRIB domain-containing protein n=1 Tax=Kwoniella pini CBS 10737 TaxID=1296096 RepID=A0A1B9HWP0_9TREE|nr:uncharacterized protein I206_06575 [Kwoniella pini CBS 10737]OCF47670.1 hypothetical protein I206_06575 [Kwoniella pini CBS 10737]